MCYVFSFLNHKHLTTFVLDRKDAMITVDDGIRKLKLQGRVSPVEHSVAMEFLDPG